MPRQFSAEHWFDMWNEKLTIKLYKCWNCKVRVSGQSIITTAPFLMTTTTTTRRHFHDCLGCDFFPIWAPLLGLSVGVSVQLWTYYKQLKLNHQQHSHFVNFFSCSEEECEQNWVEKKSSSQCEANEKMSGNRTEITVQTLCNLRPLQLGWLLFMHIS